MISHVRSEEFRQKEKHGSVNFDGYVVYYSTVTNFQRLLPLRFQKFLPLYTILSSFLITIYRILTIIILLHSAITLKAFFHFFQNSRRLSFQLLNFEYPQNLHRLYNKHSSIYILRNSCIIKTSITLFNFIATSVSPLIDNFSSASGRSIEFADFIDGRV